MNYNIRIFSFCPKDENFMDINLLEGKVGILYSFNWSKLITIL